MQCSGQIKPETHLFVFVTSMLAICFHTFKRSELNIQGRSLGISSGGGDEFQATALIYNDNILIVTGLNIAREFRMYMDFYDSDGSMDPPES